jgi:molybdopterin converting factor small subunit
VDVHILLFGPAQRIAEQSSITVRVDGTPTCHAVRQAVAVADPRLADFVAQARLAVNQKLAPENSLVCPGDEVALIGMVSGG